MSHFETAFRYAILNEGEQSNHPADTGKLTRWGITTATAQNHRCLEHPQGINVKDVNVELARHIYLLDYWIFEGIKNPEIAVKLFDLGVNFGPKTAAMLAQETVNSINLNDPNSGKLKTHIFVDGILGKVSCAAINSINPRKFLDQLEYHVDDRYWTIIYNSLVKKFGKKAVDSTQAVFGKGWLRRSNKRFYIE